MTTASGNDYVYSGSAATGPFAAKIVVYLPATTLSGIAIVGGAVSGRDQSYSLIGDADTRPGGDLPRRAHLFDRRRPDGQIRGVAHRCDGERKLDDSVPADWAATGEAQGTLIPDLNGDGYPDFAVGNASGTVAGKVVAYW